MARLLQFQSTCKGRQSWWTQAIRQFSRDEDFIQRSTVPTYHFQPSLPRLPIPELAKSCERYINAQKPLLTDQELTSVQMKVKEFEQTDGPSLQKKLKEVDSANKHTSYICKDWFDMYLSDRKPLPINYNPFLVFTDDPKTEYNSQLIRSTNLLISSLRFMKSLRAKLLEPEVYHMNPKKSDTKFFRTVTGALPSSISWYGAYLFKAFPLDMSQYENLFNTTRIPDIDRDRIFRDDSARHIIVMRGGNFYKMNVLDESGYILDPVTLFTCLNYILSVKPNTSEYPVGILTTEERNTWAKARRHLESIGNGSVLKEIDSAIFNLILDDCEPTHDYVKLSHQYLHSDGVNRWFDKSFSLIVAKNGVAGLNFEHSWGDGVAVLRYFQDIHKDSTTKPRIHPDTQPNNTSPKDILTELSFKLDDEAKHSIKEAKNKYDKTTSNLGLEIKEFLQFGKNLCKKRQISPDSIMQLSFQMAHYKLHGKYVSTYESCSTAAFKHGRTETVRPCTVESKAASTALASKNKLDKNDVLDMLKKCSDKHGVLIKEAAMGQGFDRHFFALRLLAEAEGKRLPIFTDPLYTRSNHYTMSTSTLGSEVVMLGAFGPVVADGFGIGYSIWDERLGAIVTYKKGQADGVGYIECLKESLEDLYEILK